MSEIYNAVLDRSIKERKIVRRTAIILGIISACVPVLTIMTLMAFQATLLEGFGRWTGYLIGPLVASVPTLLAISITFVGFSLAIRKRIALIKSLGEEEIQSPVLFKKFRSDRRGLLIFIGILALLVIVPLVTWLVTKDLQVAVPLRPGECCLQADGTSGQWTSSPQTISAIVVLALTGPYALSMTALSSLAVGKVSKKLRLLGQVEVR